MSEDLTTLLKEKLAQVDLRTVESLLAVLPDSFKGSIETFVSGFSSSDIDVFRRVNERLTEKVPASILEELTGGANGPQLALILTALCLREGAAILTRLLPLMFSPDEMPLQADMTQSNACRIWELCGLSFLSRRGYWESLPIFNALYDHYLQYQKNTGLWTHKAMALVWMSDCFRAVNYPMLARRYLMLTLVDDAIIQKGDISAEKGGIYFRLVWSGLLSDLEIKTYAKRICELEKQNPQESLFPEWVLQQIDQNWVRGAPSADEAGFYITNTRYIRHMLDKLGSERGMVLEQLAEYLICCMPGYRTKRRRRGKATEYDLVCSVDGLEVDFRSEMGRYLVCECKDWKKKADFSSFAKFCRVLDSTKSKFGILFSRSGLTGSRRTTAATREQLKVFQDRGIVIVVIDSKDLDNLAKGENLINLLRDKYESVRLDL